MGAFQRHNPYFNRQHFATAVQRLNRIHKKVTILILIDNTLQQDLLKISGYVPESQSLF